MKTRIDASVTSPDQKFMRPGLLFPVLTLLMALSACGGGGGDLSGAETAPTNPAAPGVGAADAAAADYLQSNAFEFTAQSDPGYNTAFDQSDRWGGGLAINAADKTTDYRLPGYSELVFADEFDGPELDRSKWCTRFSWGGGPLPLQVPDDECLAHGQGSLDFVNDEWQRYRDYNLQGETMHVFKDGVLSLRATKNNADPADKSFEGAMLRSKATFRPEGSQAYYFTARVRLPSARGTWPMIWLAPDLDDNGNSQWPPEIDILEAPVNDETETIYNLYQHLQIHHNQTDSGTHEYLYADQAYNTEWGYWKSINSLREIWLEIGAEWTPSQVCYFINGHKLACEKYRWVDNDGVMANPGNLLINMAIGGQWPGKHGVDLSKFPVRMELDHVRVYRR